MTIVLFSISILTVLCVAVQGTPDQSCYWQCANSSQLLNCKSPNDIIQAMWVCDYPGCNMSVPSPQPGQNPCFGAAIHALMCCTSPTSAKEETNPSKFVGISSEGDEVEVKVTDIQEDFPTDIVLVNDTDAFVCGNTGSRVGCPSGYKASGLCLGQNCPALTGCGSQYNYVVQCSKYNQKSTCMWVFLWEHSELQCGDGYIAGFCDTFPDYNTAWGCQLFFEYNSFGINCCYS